MPLYSVGVELVDYPMGASPWYGEDFNLTKEDADRIAREKQAAADAAGQNPCATRVYSVREGNGRDW